ncbi:MAG: peptidoglycan DD-metalloendopeptidase family protein [Candidatus Pacebacteria bacterium]|nr:peptidoglycan DD-metalloendopeptidase family protein [Candidatus Paceibacterota bacterium]
MNKKLSLGNYSIKKNKIIRFAKTPKGRFFAIILCFVFFLAVSVNPFEKSKNSNVWADQVSEFINLDQGLLPASGAILVNDNGVASPINSPLFVSSENLATLMQEDTNSNQQNNNSIIKYTVQKGETISEIAEKFSISTETILLANELSSMKIKEGQELIILPISGIMHMVEKGETIASIAKQYGSDSERIAEFNNLNDKKEVYLGDLLIIPDGKPVKNSPIVAGGKKQEIDEDYVPPVAEIPQIDSVFIMPTKGILTQGAHYSYTSGRKNYYTAVDIANDIGTPVVAAAAGNLQIVKKVWPYGNYITILHDSGATTLYAHLSAFAEGVLPGQRVSQGQIIGYMGNTGHIVAFRGGDGSHLHFEVRGAPNPLIRKAIGSKISY